MDDKLEFMISDMFDGELGDEIADRVYDSLVEYYGLGYTGEPDMEEFAEPYAEAIVKELVLMLESKFLEY